MSSFLRGFVSLTSVGLIRSVLLLLVQWIAIKVATKEDYGIYVLIFTIFSIISTLSQNITSDYAYKILSKKESNGLLSSVADNVIRFERSVSLLGVMIYALFAFILVALNMTRLDLAGVFILGLIVFHPLSYIKNELISQDKIQKLAEFELVNIFTGFMCSLVLTYCFGVVGLALGQVILVWVRQYFSWRYHNLFSYSHSLILPDLKVLNDYRPMAIRNGLQNIYQNADLIAMKLLFGEATIAEYKLAKSLGSISSKLLNPMWSALRGKIFRPYVSGNIKESVSFILRGISVVVVVYAALMILNYSVGGEIIKNVYGVEFQKTESYIYWVLILLLIKDSSLSWFGLLLSVNSWDNFMNWCYGLIILIVSSMVLLHVGEFLFLLGLVMSSIALLIISFIKTFEK